MSPAEKAGGTRLCGFAIGMCQTYLNVHVNNSGDDLSGAIPVFDGLYEPHNSAVMRLTLCLCALAWDSQTSHAHR